MQDAINYIPHNFTKTTSAYMLLNKLCLSFFIYSSFKIHTDSHNTESFRFGIQRFFVRIA